MCTWMHIVTLITVTPYNDIFTQEHISKFESAGIGLPELPHITAEQLKQLGIPLGHRTRILQEAHKLA